MNIIAYAIDHTGIYCSDGTEQHQPPYLDFLLDKPRDCIQVFSDLNHDVGQLLKLLQLTEQELTTLNDKGKLYIAPYTLMYIPKKWFSIDKGFGYGHPFAGFSDISQYADELSTRTKTDKLTAYATSKRAQEAYEAFTPIGLKPTSLISPANIYRKSSFYNRLSIPPFDSVPTEAMQLAYECVKGNWLEAFAIGYWQQAYDYDLNSAYPYQASLLYDMNAGEWQRSAEFQKQAYYGYCKAKVNITSSFSPIIYTHKDNSYTPHGEIETTLTKREIEFINYYKLGTVQILDGWWWTPSNSPSCPFRLEINRLYALKESASGIGRDIIKRIMAGVFYGMFIELRQGEFGDHFFAPYAAEIESRTRLRLANICLQNQILPLHIAVDGMITDRPITKMPSAPMGIGGLRLEHQGPAIICSSGLVTMQGKIGKGDFSIQYDQLQSLINNDPLATSYTIIKQEPLTLAQAANLHRIQDVGKVETVSRTITFGDGKREYETAPRCFGNLIANQYHSQPWDVKMIEALNEIKGV